LYKLLIRGKLSKELRKLNKKNHVLLEAIFKKADEICINPQHYKNLNYPLNKYKRVHIDSNGSPLFRVDIITKTNAGKLKKHLIHKE
jgi:hypothetical protein